MFFGPTVGRSNVLVPIFIALTVDGDAPEGGYAKPSLGGGLLQTGKMADYLAIVAAVAAAAAVWGAVLSSRMVCWRRQMTGIPVCSIVHCSTAAHWL